MRVEVHGQRTRNCITHLGSYLVTYASMFENLDAIALCPSSRLLVKIYFIHIDCRNHVIDEDAKTPRFSYLLNFKVMLHRFEVLIGVAREVVCEYKVWFDSYFVASVDAGQSAGPG